MYESLSKRRTFVHDVWVLAKSTENKDLKVDIINDPYFYIKRSDILLLLKTKDNDIINYML